MRPTQLQKAERFRELHAREGAFVIPNPWDAGSARILAALGFEALTTTSAGLAFTLGRRDGSASRQETLANARVIVDATDLPVAADLENGFGDSPDDAAKTDSPARAKRQGSSAARSKMRRAIRANRSTTSGMPPNAWLPRSKRRARCPSRSFWWAR